ncbi:MAG: hypothetical protein ACKO6N_16725 [Myxococcota bacterium]
MALNLKVRFAALVNRIGNASLVVRFRTLYESLSPRDRRLFIGLSAFFLMVLVGTAAWSGNRYLNRLEQENQRKQEQLVRILEVQLGYDELKKQITDLEAQLKGNVEFNLTSFLENTANTISFPNQVNIQSKGEETNEGVRSVKAEVKVRKAPLESILKYLHAVESAPQRLHVKNLRIRTTFNSRAELDMELEVVVLTPQEG